MGKKGVSDKVRNKRQEKSKQLPNPFEVKVNKVKHVVVNKKVQSWEKGLPGVSRSKAVKKRKDTLLKELHHSKKSNSLLDKRFGEGDSSLTADEKMVQRFAMEKKKKVKNSDFNLDDNEEILTHYGQSLAENLQDTIGSDSDDDEQAIKDITGDLQFGGLSRDDSGLSWKDKMKDIIADSKKQKFERQAQKEKVVETTNELDSVWKTVAPSLKIVMKRPAPNKKASNYMLLFHNLVREQKSDGATDKLKTDEERAKEEAEKLQMLEAQRLSRMRGDSNKPVSNHVSADDLNDGFSFERKKHKVSFHDANDVNANEDETDASEEEEDENKDSEEEEDEKAVKVGEILNAGEGGGEESSGDEDDEDEEEEEEEGSDNFSDLASDSNEDEEDTSSQNEESDKESQEGQSKKKASVKSILKKPQGKLQDKKPKAFSQTSELPFIFPAPGSYEELAALLHGHSAEEQNTILSRLRKCHHPSLAEGNKQKLQEIHQYLLHYFGELLLQESIDKTLVHHVISHVWDMSQMFPETTAVYMQKLVIERQKEYADFKQRRNGKATFVQIDMLMHFSLIEGLFPTSDYRHPVTTPTISFIAQMLSECSVRNMKDCITGLFLCAQALQFIRLSKRFIPEVVTFLHGLLVLGADKNEASGVKTFPPLKNNGHHQDLLEVKEKCELSSEWCITDLLSKDPDELNTDQFRCDTIATCIKLLQECLNLWQDLPHLAAVVKPIKEPLFVLPVQNYPEDLKESIHLVKSKIRESETKKLRVMQQPSKRPEPLKMFEPKVDEFWTGKKKKGGPNRETNERQRLTHKLKREMKAAVREIKRDNEVLAAHQLEEISKKDAERKRKTKDLMNSLANQEGDYQAIKRAKH